MILDALDDLIATDPDDEAWTDPGRWPADALFLFLDLGFLAALAAFPLWAPHAMGVMLGLL